MEFGILGPLEIRDGDREVRVAGGKQRALLAILLLHANEVVSSDRLIDDLWGEEPPASGATALQVRVSGLRKALGSRGAVIVTQRPGYLVRLESGQLDLNRFEALVSESDGAEPSIAAAKLREALALWRGPPLAEFAYESFAQGAIGRLDELRLVALERRIEADLELGRHRNLVGELETLVAANPLRERFRGQLMLALYRSGRQAEALEAYAAARVALVEELGLEPSRALQELEQQILRQEASLEPSRPGAPIRSILVASFADEGLEALLTLARPLARHSTRDLIITQVLIPADLTATTRALHQRREALLADGYSARTAAFTSTRPGEDIVRLATEQDVDLLLMSAGHGLLEDDVARVVLRSAPCDVALVVAREEPTPAGPVLVPFGGAEHDWTAIELGAWLARAEEVPLRLAGPHEDGRDASRLLASASLAVQRALGVAAEPLLIAPGPDGLLAAAEEAAVVVVGLSDRWSKDGLGRTRAALASQATSPVVIVRRGLRPGGIAPPQALTRFTWTVGSAASASSS
jgi:DNA-binding SARP family transcriptional activator